MSEKSGLADVGYIGTLAGVVTALLVGVGASTKILSSLVNLMVDWVKSKDKKISELSKEARESSRDLGKAQGQVVSLQGQLEEAKRKIYELEDSKDRAQILIRELQKRLDNREEEK